MLKQINIKNFAIFEDASIEPGSGYNVITGESGAGKSIIVDALSLIRGARAYREMIRTGTDHAIVEAVFQIDENKMEQLGFDENTLVITRRINQSKTSECRINGKIRSLSEIVEVTGELLDIHGQYENQTLADSENHILYLDSFAGSELSEVMENYQKKHSEYKRLIHEIIELSGSASERERNKEIYEFQLNEINSAGLDELSEQELNARWILLKNAEKYERETTLVYQMLENEENSPYAMITESIKMITELPENDELLKITEKLKESSYVLLDAISSIRDFRDSIMFDDKEFTEINDRMDAIRKLKRKYGNSIESILEFRNRIAGELDKIANYEKNNSEILEKLGFLESYLLKLSKDLFEIRSRASEELKDKLLEELSEMGMGDAEFKVILKDNISKNSIGLIDFGKTGLSECEFLISLNKGLEPQELGKVASGGEMSRIMLAFKTIFASKEDTQTVVFDEIDSGLSGEASRSVASKLEVLSKSRQIICITHLPQIAARAGNHFLIKKESTAVSTKAFIYESREYDEIIRQIAALTDGENLTEEGMLHAAQLYNMFN